MYSVQSVKRVPNVKSSWRCELLRKEDKRIYKFMFWLDQVNQPDGDFLHTEADINDPSWSDRQKVQESPEEWQEALLEVMCFLERVNEIECHETINGQYWCAVKKAQTDSGAQ